jgi:hypothetical protein
MMAERKESWFVLLQLQPRGTDSNTSRAVKSAGRVHADHRNRGLHFTVDYRNLDDMKWRGKATLGFGPSPGRVLARVMLDSRDSTSRVVHQSCFDRRAGCTSPPQRIGSGSGKKMCGL